MKQILMLALFVTSTFGATGEVFGQDEHIVQFRPPPGGRGGPPGELPPELKAQLSAEQIEQLEAAETPQEKMKLLKSWKIAPPKRPDLGQQKKPSDALIELFDKVRDASSEIDNEAVREELREFFKASTDETDREAIRRYFSRHPSSVSQSNGSSFQTSSSSNVAR